MKILISILFISLSFNSFAWTHNDSSGGGFNKNNITIDIANTDCSNAGFSTSKYKSLIQDAVDEYWNAVPTSALYLKAGSISSSIDFSGDTFTTALAKASSGQIIAGCNDSVPDFTKGSILGAAVLDCSGSECKAVLILNAHANSTLSSQSDSYIKAVIAHELGHAIGIGHSEYSHNLMYYSVGGKTQTWLGEDDIDAVSYLYPHDSQLGGLLGSCGTVAIVGANAKHKIGKSIKNGFGFLSFFGSFSIGLIFMIFLSRKCINLVKE